jgi:hypothetical protein
VSLISNYFVTETFSTRRCPCTWQMTHEWYYSILLRCFCLQKLLIRYTLDVMHCEMNLAKNFLKTISVIKDTVKVRRDMQRRNIWRNLWLTAHNKRGGTLMKPQASYVLTLAEFEQFAETIESLKMPTRYSSSLGNHIWGKKFGSLKSHDYHVLM